MLLSVFLVFKSIYTLLCTEHDIYLYRIPALTVVTPHEVASGRKIRGLELSETARIHFGMCSLELRHRGVCG